MIQWFHCNRITRHHFGHSTSISMLHLNMTGRQPRSPIGMHQETHQPHGHKDRYRLSPQNPNVYIPPSCINNPNNQYSPKYMPLTIFNLSKVDHLYIGRDTVVAFAEEPTIDTYHIEIASEEKIQEHLAKP